jgi:hypothetical protein
MQNQILVRSQSKNQWLTTSDVARMLGITVYGVRWLARNGRLVHEATASGQRVFRQSDVLAVVEHRAKTRLTGVPEARVIGGPRQLSLFGKTRLRLVASSEG